MSLKFGEKIKKIFAISDQILKLYEIAMHIETGVYDTDGLPDMDFSFNDPDYCNIGSIIFGIIRNLIDEEKKLYDILTPEELSNAMIVFGLNKKLLLNPIYARIFYHLKEILNQKGFSQDDKLLINKILAAAEVSRFTIQREYIVECKDDGYFAYTAQLQYLQVALKYSRLSSNIFIEQLALKANFDIQSMDVMRPDMVRNLLKDEDKYRGVCDYFINYIIDMINALKFETNPYKISTICTFIEASLNYLPQNLLDKLSRYVNGELSDNYMSGRICKYIESISR